MSLTSDDLADIKQLMESVVSGAMAEQRAYMDRRFEEQDASIERRFSEQDAKLDVIMDAVGTRFDEQDEKVDDHEVRIMRLESRTA